MHFQRKSTTVVNALSGVPYNLRSLDEIAANSEQIARVRSICNEHEIYSWLFADSLKGQPYPQEKAAGWFQWGAKGWKYGTHFAFAALDSSGLVVAACDIKSANARAAEIGYWCSAAHRGLMTNTVSAMLILAAEAGFEAFYADAKPLNARSQGVLKRLGFSLDEAKSSAATNVRYRRLAIETM